MSTTCAEDVAAPMLTLSLLRHAKSSWDDPDLDDHERPLARRGAKAALTMGALMAANDLKPDLVLCSGAVRTRATLALVLPELGPPPPQVIYDETLYLAPASALIAYVRKLKSDARNVLVVGHNPGIHALALELIGDGRRKDITALAIKFPTCGLAVLEIDADAWSDLRPAVGRLRLFASPKRAA